MRIGIMGTQIVKLACQGCGADLEVSEGIRFMTCNFCGSKLEVVQDESVTHTRLLEDIADDLKVIQLQNDLEKLDREWASRRESFMVTSKNGHRSVPSGAGAMIGGVAGIGGGIFWMIMTSQMGAPGMFPLFGLLIIGLSIFGMVSSGTKAGAHDRAKREYDDQRRKLAAELESARSGK